jgi:hypothetical protein
MWLFGYQWGVSMSRRHRHRGCAAGEIGVMAAALIVAAWHLGVAAM